jgi:hypothetical protein
MDSLRDTFDDLKLAILGTSSTKIDMKLDAAVKDISAYKSQSGRNGYINLVRSLIAKTDIQLSGQLGTGLFSQGIAGPASFGQGHRLSRYKTYEAIVYMINYCYRALSVLVDNIISPDDITKESLEIKARRFLEDALETESRVKYTKEVIQKLKIEENLQIIVRSTLLYGDFFCEIADTKTALINKTLLSEAQYNEYIETQIKQGLIETMITSTNDPDYKRYNGRKINLDCSQLKEQSASTKGKKTNKDTSQSLSNYTLLYHDPKFVIKLQSSFYPLCFGYLIFPAISVQPNLAFQEEPITNICKMILKKIQEKIPEMEQFDDKEDLQDIIKSMLERGDPTKALNIRYVAPDRMVHFKVPSTKYRPYGESIFDSSQYTAKVLIALETALAIQRLSRSTEKRKISIEVGVPRDAKKAIENLKEAFRKRKVSLDSFGTVDTIPSMLTTFEDIYIPMKDGKPYVDVSSFTEGNVDVRSKVDELRFLRDQVVASLGVPASFINIEENLSNKAALSEENILFARTVISHQKYIGRDLASLIEQVTNITQPEKALTLLENVFIGFSIPRSLQFEREARYMTDLANLVETLERIGIPKEYSRKKYLPNIDWEEVKKYQIDTNIETSLDPKKAQEEEMGGGGMGMGMGMPMGPVGPASF